MNFKNIITITILFVFINYVAGGLISAGLAYVTHKNQKTGQEKLEHMIEEKAAEIELKQSMGVMPNDNTDTQPKVESALKREYMIEEKAAENKLTQSMSVMPDDNTTSQANIKRMIQKAAEIDLKRGMGVMPNYNIKIAEIDLNRGMDVMPNYNTASQPKVESAIKVDREKEKLALIPDDPKIQKMNVDYTRDPHQKNQFDAFNLF
ncbi:uncharacterized protein LOC126840441 isoform X2 [Adelges cooleyi]|uniref:uncharacterized protein LOC126840441 isoform X2 n=1 Tax=Adelges cooleyi TaxID=133065 RepID=UPI00217F245C|nr:uncharacterized protein LOC126840441 isoform X2 [Adelges cooleyi]